MLKWRGLLPVLGTCAAIVALAATLAPRWMADSRQQLIADLDQQIAALDELRASTFVRTLRTHDGLALGSLVRAMADERPMVAAAARETVVSLVSDWRGLPARDSVPRLTALAGHLADQYEFMSPQDQQLVRQLAQALLAWPLVDADFPADNLVVQCERVLALPVPEFDPEDRGDLPRVVDVPPESPQVARRPGAAPLPGSNDQGNAAPIVDLPVLTPVGDDELDPSMPAEAGDAPRIEPRPVPPRQFLRPRVAPIPAADEP